MDEDVGLTVRSEVGGSVCLKGNEMEKRKGKFKFQKAGQRGGCLKKGLELCPLMNYGGY